MLMIYQWGPNQLIDSVPLGGPGRAILEQLLNLAASEQYEPIGGLVRLLAEKAQNLPLSGYWQNAA